MRERGSIIRDAKAGELQRRSDAVMTRTLDLKLESLALMGLPGVAGVGYGLKETGGKITPVRALRVYVLKKLPPCHLGKNELVPSHIGEVCTDVIERAPVMPTHGGRELVPRPGARIAN